jgi:hypothetical protein
MGRDTNDLGVRVIQESTLRRKRNEDECIKMDTIVAFKKVEFDLSGLMRGNYGV